MGSPAIAPNIPAGALLSDKAQNVGDPFFRIQYSIMETIFSSSLHSQMQFLFFFFFLSFRAIKEDHLKTWHHSQVSRTETGVPSSPVSFSFYPPHDLPGHFAFIAVRWQPKNPAFLWLLVFCVHGSPWSISFILETPQNPDIEKVSLELAILRMSFHISWQWKENNVFYFKREHWHVTQRLCMKLKFWHHGVSLSNSGWLAEFMSLKHYSSN